jgi:hypothetical protein
MNKNFKLIKLSILCILLLSVTFGCNLPTRTESSENAASSSPMKLGEMKEVLGGVLVAGKAITVDSPGNPLDGMQIYAPENSLTEPVEINISYQEVKSHSYGEHFEPITPLIDIDLQNVSPEDFLEITVPLKVPDGYFALPFHIDPETNQLEGLPVVGETADSLTFVSKRFSKFIFAMVREIALYEDIDTSFVFGKSNFKFPNMGSWFTPNGHCAGQSLANLYYHEKYEDKPLFDAYDGYDTAFFETPDLWEDDVMVYKLSSIVQSYAWIAGNPDVIYWTNFEISDPLRTYFTVAYLMLVTGKPQLIVLDAVDGGGGHAIIAYQKTGSIFNIYDPNFPKDSTRTVAFDLDGSLFQDYHSGLEADGAPITFNQFYFIPPKDIVNWELIGDLWSQVDNGSLTSDPFPHFRINIVDRDSSFQQLPAIAVEREYETNNAVVDVFVDQINIPGEVTIWQTASDYQTPTQIATTNIGETTYLNLNQGENYFGFNIKTRSEKGSLNWAGFKWIKITLSESDDEQEDKKEDQANLSLEECDMTHYLTVEMEGAKTLDFPDTSPCSHDCSAKIKITNDSSELVNIFYFQYAFARDTGLSWTGERWDGFGATAPGDVKEYGFFRRYEVSGDCQWVNQGVSKIGAIRSDQRCTWLADQYNNNFDGSGIEWLEIVSPCP